MDLSNSMRAIAKAVVNPATLANEETKVEGLTRCKKQMLKSRDKWTDSQEELHLQTVVRCRGAINRIPHSKSVVL